MGPPGSRHLAGMTMASLRMGDKLSPPLLDDPIPMYPGCGWSSSSSSSSLVVVPELLTLLFRPNSENAPNVASFPPILAGSPKPLGKRNSYLWS